MKSEPSQTVKSRPEFRAAHMEHPDAPRMGESSPLKPKDVASTSLAHDISSPSVTAPRDVIDLCTQEGLQSGRIPNGMLVLGSIQKPPFLCLQRDLISTWVVEAKGETADQLVVTFFVSDGGAYQVTAPPNLKGRLESLLLAIQLGEARQLPWPLTVKREPF